eukprot:355968-Chlamydomonas_euryale.AAC.5
MEQQCDNAHSAGNGRNTQCTQHQTSATPNAHNTRQAQHPKRTTPDKRNIRSVQLQTSATPESATESPQRPLLCQQLQQHNAQRIEAAQLALTEQRARVHVCHVAVQQRTAAAAVAATAPEAGRGRAGRGARRRKANVKAERRLQVRQQRRQHRQLGGVRVDTHRRWRHACAQAVGRQQRAIAALPATVRAAAAHAAVELVGVENERAASGAVAGRVRAGTGAVRAVLQERERTRDVGRDLDDLLPAQQSTLQPRVQRLLAKRLLHDPHSVEARGPPHRSPAAGA